MPPRLVDRVPSDGNEDRESEGWKVELKAVCQMIGYCASDESRPCGGVSGQWPGRNSRRDGDG